MSLSKWWSGRASAAPATDLDADGASEPDDEGEDDGATPAQREDVRRVSKHSEYKDRIESLLQLYRDGRLLLSPEYQRGDVWTKPIQRELINTIEEGRYLPAVVTSMNEDGTFPPAIPI